jgi:phosphoribosyl 1,2-cyclic phosphate phosphodiesterase
MELSKGVVHLTWRKVKEGCLKIAYFRSIMKVTFLGTGTSQGVPVIACHCPVCRSVDLKDKRLRTSIMITSETTQVVIDSGPDFRQQMLHHDVQTLDGIVYTHEHKDHVAGMDDVRAFNFTTGKPMNVFCTVQVEVALKREFAYVFENSHYPGVPKIDIHHIDNAAFTIGDITMQPLPVMHLKMPVLGFRIDDFSYVTDANFIHEATKDKIRGSKILVINALRHETHPSHFTLKEALHLIDELKIPEVYLTHISHQLGKHEDVSSTLPAHVQIAYDGLTLEI